LEAGTWHLPEKEMTALRPTDTQQKQECQTAGGTSLITASCTGVSTNIISHLGGLMREVPK